MTKRKLTVSVLAVVLVLLLAVGILAACNDTVQYTVTFKDGDTVVDTVKVDEGATLTAEQIPTREKANAVFDGWFVGETKVEAGYKVTESVTAVAKFTDKVTVTFKKGDTTVETVTVAKGTTLAANQIPACQVGADEVFDGWFVEGAQTETEVAAGYTVNANVVAVAKITDKVTVTFKVDGEVVKTVKIVKGTTVAAADMPEDPNEIGFGFDGWFNAANEEIADVDAINENVEFVAKLTKTAYVVTFVADQQTIEQKVIAFTNEGDDVTVPAQFLPGAPAGEGKFVGWYLNDAKVEEGTTTVNADVTFKAVFVSEESYVGAWIDKTDKLSLQIREKDGVYIANGASLKNATLTYNDGEFTYRTGSGLSSENYTLFATGDKLVISCSYYDEYEELQNQEYTFTRGEAVDYAGIYRAGNSDFIKITDGGVIYSINTDSFVGEAYFVIVEDDGSFVIETKNDINSTVESNPASFDEEGNLVVANAIYVKVASETAAFDDYYNADIGTLKIFGEGAEATIVFAANDDASYYATIDGTIAEGEVFTINYEKDSTPQSVTVKLVDDALVVRGAEFGNFAGDDGALTLDGFGAGTLNANAIAYTKNAAGIVFINDAAYKISTTDNSYSKPVPDAYQGTFVYDENRSVTFDGYGEVTFYYYSNSKGTYEVAEGVVTSSISSVNGCRFSENNEVLDDGYYTYIKQGIKDYAEDFAGYWTVTEDTTEHSLLISADTDPYTGKKYVFVKVDGGSNIRTEGNYNHSIITFTDGGKDYTLTLGNEPETKTVILSWEDTAPVTRTYAYAGAEPPAPPFAGFDADIQGTWTGTDTATSNPITVVITQDAITFNGDDGYDLGLTEDLYGTIYSFTIGDAWPTTWCITYFDGSCTLWVEGTEGAEITMTKQGAVTPSYDAFKGTWKGTLGVTEYTFVFDGVSSVNVSADETSESVSYTTQDNVATFTYLVYSVTCTLNESTLDVNMDDGGDNNFSGAFTKQAEQPVLDAFAGTWIYKDTEQTITVVFDGQGNGTWNETAFTYEIYGSEATFTVSEVEYTVSVQSDTELFVSNSDYSFMKTFTKQTEQQPEVPAFSFVGTWRANTGMILVFDETKVYDNENGYNAEYRVHENGGYYAWLYEEDCFITVNPDGTFTIAAGSSTYAGTYTKIA